ncbi:hypothetical protein DICPUDRAFT_151547 [Dictyostelium purpureum]|uniref:Thioesterase domain-containing protein n=1 Tax=Dictyostelium purpureum TaxID=5786 RepID=F0ZJ46_DICPU|nr:uncharacterized protein DICPUDRAFT_151547 [Dictyostelium purpureum]EGC36065.1 hypothetical protein DICPUDRAFT_151547 [Dictyostelium purpureum]|eukprot:XP_003287440.1 hypothetical protein DICPUDRAFT_151547 [Dictyostelium purpureum]
MFKYRSVLKTFSTLNKLKCNNINSNAIINSGKLFTQNNNCTLNNSNKFFTTSNNNDINALKLEELIKSDLIHDMKSFLTFKNEKDIQFTSKQWLDILKLRGGRGLPNYMDLDVVDVKDDGTVKMNLKVGKHHVASNGYVHAASVICLADTACGYGCFSKLPKGAFGFTTIELKSNFLGTAAEGDLLECESTLVHAGRSTQVWDAIVKHGNKTLALFRCTEIVLYPQPKKN